jgi:hypothetical protein
VERLVIRLPAHATRLPALWTPPGRVIDLGQLHLAMPLESPPSRAMTFCAGDADDDGVVRILAVSL